MNKLREIAKEEVPVRKVNLPAGKAGKKSKTGQYFLSIISGSFLTKEETLKLIPFVMFLFAMAILYIANGYYAEEKVRQLSKVTNELKELKSEYITSKSDLMFISKQSEVAKAALNLDIKESVVPPKKILVEVKSDNTINKESQ